MPAAGCQLSSREAGPDGVLSGRIQVDAIVTNISNCTLLSFSVVQGKMVGGAVVHMHSQQYIVLVH